MSFPRLADVGTARTKGDFRRRAVANAALDFLLWPLARAVTWWARRREQEILRAGKPLTEDHMALARAVGVTAPHRVRVMPVSAVPMPLPSWLRRAAQHAGWLSPDIAGMTLGYGIVLRHDVCGDRRLLAHELAHVAQYERFGRADRSKPSERIGGFMREYVRECVWPGYPRGPLEMEAQQAERAARQHTQMVAPPRMQRSTQPPTQVSGECDTVLRYLRGTRSKALKKYP